VPTARRCQGCGATLAEPAGDTGVVTCRFCGLAHDTAHAYAPPVVQIHVGRQVRRGGRLIAIVVVVVVLVVVVSALVPAIMSFRLAQTAVDRVATRVADRVATRPAADPRAPIAPADLGAIAAGGGWKTLAVDPPPGGYAAFEPVAALPWATAVARAWADDARLTRIDVGRITASGVVDLGGEQTSGYRFVSAGRWTRRQNELDAGDRSGTGTGLLLTLKGTTVTALVHDERRDDDVPAPASLPLPVMLERARKAEGFVDRPFYTGYMIHLPREGWVWYLRPLAANSSMPRLRARDGRAYPY
jgi:hypothetical protein